MENLHDHINRLGITQSAFAAQLGISKSYLSQIMSGQRVPGRAMIAKINIATGGKVPPSVWFSATKSPR